VIPSGYETPQFREWRQKTDRTLKRIFGPDHDFVGQLDDISFWGLTDNASLERKFFESGRSEAEALLKGAIYELEVLAEPTEFASAASIDPELWEHVHRLVESEQWAQVASQTAIFVESKARQWAGLPDAKFGKDLMVAVLKPGDGRFPLGRTAGEAEGWLALGIGIAMAVGNADRHRIQLRDDAKGSPLGDFARSWRLEWEVYTAVLRDGVRTPEQFARWLAANDFPTLDEAAVGTSAN
jgi:hypothetical protein